MRILMAEDEPDIARIYSEMLSGNGFDVVTAGDGEEVLLKLAEDRFELLILDLFMPRVTGFEVLKRMREAGQTVPVIVMTGHFPDEEVEEGIEGFSVSTILRKPVMISTLLNAVNQAVEKDE